MNLPSVVPVMLLPQCNVFPHGLLPLHIFEPRYRAMLRHALQTDRMLCIGTLMQPADGDGDADFELESDDRIHEYSTAAVVRACVGNEDGTSHLVLQGMQRVRFVAWEQYEPFRIARIESVPTVCRDIPLAERKGRVLMDQVMGLIRQETETGKQLAVQLARLADPGHLADFVAGNLIRDAMSRQPVLGMPEVADRLDYLTKLLEKTGGRPAKS